MDLLDVEERAVTGTSEPKPAARILIIDDDAIVARSMARRLSTMEVLIETDPRRASERILAGEQFDVILCDLRMPAMNGREVLELIRAHYAGRTDGPKVIMTSGSDDLLEPWAEGAAVIAKPFRPQELLALIESLFSAE
jgi:CheY-like chemotaxis protein